MIDFAMGWDFVFEGCAGQCFCIVDGRQNKMVFVSDITNHKKTETVGGGGMK